MADLSDIETALVAAIAQIIYPTGTGNPSLIGNAVNIYRGWPVARNLDRDLAAGTINITVFAQDNERKVTRFPQEWQVLAQPVVGLAAIASGNTLTFAGTVSTPLNIAVTANNQTHVYAVQASDTPTTIATAVAQLVGLSSSGPVVTASSPISAVIGGAGTMIRELRRQKRGFIVTLWCPDPGTRDSIAGPLDDALAAIDYLNLPDGTVARILYEKTTVSDRSERDNLYRRDLFYSAEYATTQSQIAYQIVDVILNFADYAGNPLFPSIGWDRGRWDDGTSTWPATVAWDSGYWDDGGSTWAAQTPARAWDSGMWDDGISAWPAARTWDFGGWDSTMNWDS